MSGRKDPKAPVLFHFSIIKQVTTENLACLLVKKYVIFLYNHGHLLMNITVMEICPKWRLQWSNAEKLFFSSILQIYALSSVEVKKASDSGLYKALYQKRKRIELSSTTIAQQVCNRIVEIQNLSRRGAVLTRVSFKLFRIVLKNGQEKKVTRKLKRYAIVPFCPGVNR